MAGFKTFEQGASQTTEEFDRHVNRICDEQGYRIISGGANPDGTKFVMLEKLHSIAVPLESRQNVIREVEENVLQRVTEGIEKASEVPRNSS